MSKHEQSAEVSRWLRWPGALMVIGVAVLLGQGWMMSLEFQLDDFEQLYDAAEWGRSSVLMGSDQSEKKNIRARPSFVQFFRPVLHASFLADMALFGPNPAAIHAASVFWHFVACFLLFLVACRILPGPDNRRTALFAAVIFALHPGKWSAISWIAARGDLLMVVFLLAGILAWHRFRLERRLRDYGLTLLMLLLALGSKEGGLVGPILLGILDLAYLRKRGQARNFSRALLELSPLLVITPIYLLYRHWRFGSMANLYAGQPRVMTWPIAERMASDFFPVSQKLLTGWFYQTSTGVLEWLGAILGILFVLALGLWATRRPWRRSFMLTLLAVLYGVAILPPLRFYREANGFDASRLFYLPNLLICVALALAAQGFYARLRILRRATLVFVLFLVLVSSFSAWQHYLNQRGAAEILRRTQQDLETFALSSPHNDTAFAVLDLPIRYGSAPCYGTFLTYAFGAPFQEPTILAKSVINEQIFLGNEHLMNSPWPVRILRWTADDDDLANGRLVPATPVLPAPNGWRPRIDLSADQNEVKFDRQLSPRDVRCIAFEFDPAPAEPFSISLVFEDEYGSAAFRATLDWSPKEYGSSTRAYVPLEREPRWLYQGGLRSFRIERSSGDVNLKAIDFGARLPVIEIVSPRGQVYAITGAEPAYVIRDRHDFPWFRVCLFLHGSVRTWTLRRSELEVQGKDLVFRASQPGFIRKPPSRREDPIYWDDLNRGDGNDLLGRLGISEISLDWWVEGLRGQVDPERHAHAQGRSDVGNLTIRR